MRMHFIIIVNIKIRYLIACNLSSLMMAPVVSRNVSGPNISLYKAVVLFFSKIILRKLNNSSMKIFRNLENSCKKSTKLNADLKYLISLS